jgi:integrase
MISARKRGKTFHVDFLKDRSHVVRGSLGTRNGDAARRVVHKLETAVAEGPGSDVWPELRALLPRDTYERFANYVGVKTTEPPTWVQLRDSFTVFLEQREKINRIRQSTVDRYLHTVREFELFLSENKTTLLRDVTKPLVEAFKVWRSERINKRKHSRGATGLVLDVAILHRVFSFAVEREMILKNPVQMEGRPGDNPMGGAEPYAADELSQMRRQSGSDLLAFLLLRWTGLRGSDVVNLTWSDVHLNKKEIERITQKRRKKVMLPIHSELLFALEIEHDQRNPGPNDTVLLNPATGQAMTRPRLYQRIQALGGRAGVRRAHPHRFRDTLAVDMLTRGASPYDVAKMLGDTIDTVERHYTPFVRELRERVRNFLETGIGLEELARKGPERLQITPKKPN